jgi:hypothetical protein
MSLGFLSSECGGRARDSAKIVDQVRLLAGTLLKYGAQLPVGSTSDGPKVVVSGRPDTATAPGVCLRRRAHSSGQSVGVDGKDPAGKA